MAKTSRLPATRARKYARIVPSKQYRILVELSPYEKVANLSRFHLQHSCMPQSPPAANGSRDLHAFAPGTAVTALRKAGRKVTVLADADAESRRLQRNIGKGDRFKGGRSGPTGVGRLR